MQFYCILFYPFYSIVFYSFLFYSIKSYFIVFHCYDFTALMQVFIFFPKRLLVSGSDDFNIIVWEALKYRLGCKINSGHSGNIFSVKVKSYHLRNSKCPLNCS